MNASITKMLNNMKLDLSKTLLTFLRTTFVLVYIYLYFAFLMDAIKKKKTFFWDAFFSSAILEYIDMFIY